MLSTTKKTRRTSYREPRHEHHCPPCDRQPLVTATDQRPLLRLVFGSAQNMRAIKHLDLR
jgi:hypothetical protein